LTKNTHVVQAQVEALAKEISEKQSKAEELGQEGDVDESLALLKKADELKVCFILLVLDLFVCVRVFHFARIDVFYVCTVFFREFFLSCVCLLCFRM
jgi:hypothetical protein